MKQLLYFIPFIGIYFFNINNKEGCINLLAFIYQFICVAVLLTEITLLIEKP